MKHFFTSDLHIGHYSIIRMCNRPFESVEDMSAELIRRNNEVVTNDDIVYDLGDVGFRCNDTSLSKVLHEMNGKRKIITGNHDETLRDCLRKGMLDDLIKSGRLEFIGAKEYNHALIVTLNIGKDTVILSHFAIVNWYKAHYGSYQLFGHSHGGLNHGILDAVRIATGLKKSMDVGVDTNNYYPYSWDDIKTKLDSL
jgi:calcineurin-like phosphoesterase family protein